MGGVDEEFDIVDKPEDQAAAFKVQVRSVAMHKHGSGLTSHEDN
jgi:hypothetical protein